MDICYVCREKINQSANYCGNTNCQYKVHVECAKQMMHKRSRRCGCGNKIDTFNYYELKIKK
jgi:hypothetical protein